MKIAIISSGFLPVPAVKGGAVECLVENILIKNEDYQKFDIEVFTVFDNEAQQKSINYKKTKFKYIKVNGITKIIDEIMYWLCKNILKKENSHSYRFVFQRLAYLRKVSKYLKKNDYDKVILENHATQFLTLKWHNNAEKYKNKFFYHCHNEVNNDYGCVEVMKQTNKFICISDFIKNDLKQHFEFINNDNTVILKNCIDTKAFSSDVDKDNVKDRYGIDKNKKIIVYTGRLVEEKGILKLISALKYLKTEDYQLVIAGGVVSKIDFETTFTKKLNSECEKYKEKIIFTGYIEHEQISDIYKIADVVVLPSIWNEPAGLTMLEAMASGSPLITTDVGGIGEYIKSDAAILLKNDEFLEENIGNSINNILEDDEFKLEISKKGIKYAEEFNLDNYYNNFVKIME